MYDAAIMKIKNIFRIFAVFAISNICSATIDFVNNGSENFSIFSRDDILILKPKERRKLDLNFFQIVPTAVFGSQPSAHNFYASFSLTTSDKLDPKVTITQDECGNSYLQSPILYQKTVNPKDERSGYAESVYSIVEFNNNNLKTVRILAEEGGKITSQLVHPDETVKVLISSANNRSGITVLPETGISTFVRYYDIPLQKRRYKIDFGYLYSKEPLEIARESGSL